MLDYKVNYLLKLLISSDVALNITDIQKLLGVSQRSAYYSISKINDYLDFQGLPKLNHKRQEGIYIDPLIKEKLVVTVSSTLSELYICTSAERIALEILMLLCKNDFINILYFESLFSLSRNTIINDIKDIRRMIGTYNLSLEYDSCNGYVIAGLPIRKRSVILNLISNYDYLVKIKSFGLFTDEVVAESFTLLKVLEKELNIRYVTTTLVNLSVLISIIRINCLEHIVLSDDDKKIIENSQEYKAVVKNGKGIIDETEYDYLALHLHGFRIHFTKEYELQEDDYVSEIVEFLISEFSRITLIYFADDRDLFNHLYTHMKQAMFRLRYGIIYQNELKEKILKTYPQVSHVTRSICKKLEKKIGFPIGDDDITFIAMHFGGYLIREERVIVQVKVLLVCLNGIAASKLLSKEIDYLIGNIEIIDAVSLDEVNRYKNQVDYIISTIPIKDATIKDRTLIVSPILTDLDKSRIISFMDITHSSKNDHELSEMIVQDIMEYIPKDKVSEVRKMVLNHISNNKSEKSAIERKKKYMVNDLLIKENILFEKSVDSWQDAIKISAQPLIDKNIIEQRYIDKVISNIIELGPYIVIAPNIAISHARPQDGVVGLGMTILLLEEALYFTDDIERPVRIVITLASPDNEQHLLALQQLSRLLMEDLDDLLMAREANEVIELVKKYSVEVK